MRQLIAAILGIALIAGAFLLSKRIIANKKKPEQKFTKIVKTVFVESVVNQDIPLVISSTGQLIAKNKIDLFSEVQGILESTGKDFRVGTNYRNGEAIFQINHDEFSANLQSQKSNLYTTISQILPDLKFDYQDAYPRWENYLKQFDVNKPIPDLPEPTSDKEKFFISGNGIFSQYYLLKNAEVKLSKYVIYAPFYGVVTEASVNKGMLIRPGQKLGEFISPGQYEMEVAVSIAQMDLLKKGGKVTLRNLEHTQTYTGTVVRINGKIDPTSQSVKVYIAVQGKTLKEGMYLEAELKAKTVKDGYQLDRKLLEDNQVYVVEQDTILRLMPVSPVHFDEKSVFVTGLLNGTKVLRQPIPGAYDGMKVQIFQEAK